MKKEVTIFYSWQSDNNETRFFIEKALSGAIEDITETTKLEESPRLDQDTKGKVGAPNIISTIKNKIDSCGIFVADVSIGDTSQKKKRKLVNQNVMFELGYALAKRTEDNLVLLFNTDLGETRDLPLDIFQNRLLPFSLTNDKDGKKLRERLVKVLEEHLHHLKVWETERIEAELEDIELLIMRVLASMGDDKRIMTHMSMAGENIIPVGQIDKSLEEELNAASSQEVKANLDSLVDSGLLTMTLGSKGTPNYKPSKGGYKVIKALTKNQSE